MIQKQNKNFLKMFIVADLVSLSKHFSVKSDYFLIHPLKHTCIFGCSKNRIIETVLLSTHNICLVEIELISFSYALLSGALKNENIWGRLHDKSLKITLGLNSRLPAVDCINTGLTSLRLTLSLNSRLLPVDCIK